MPELHNSILFTHYRSLQIFKNNIFLLYFPSRFFKLLLIYNAVVNGFRTLNVWTVGEQKFPFIPVVGSKSRQKDYNGKHV